MKFHKLTKAEEEIMQMLWDKEESSTVSQLIESMPEPHPPPSTISSIVRILEKKGFVGHKAYGRTHVYFPLVGKKDYTKFSINRLVRSYFEGSPNELVSFLIKENDLSLQDLSNIIRQMENE